MDAERFRHIEALYHAACDAAADERTALLARADPELRREVELLLLERERGDFLARPAIQDAIDLLEDSAGVVLATGAHLGPYRIEHKLGEGGMGEVFRAVDTRLGRAVAIKIAKEEFSEHFECEARAIAALNHPNICTLYDVGPHYLVMELVEGDTLAAWLKRGPLPLTMAVSYAAQMAAALAEAHAKGVIHRDLKPGNVMIARSGIKVLDFGLAKSGQAQTVTASHAVLGTPAYMAPEQRDGRPADARSDIYAFGCVLYEMVTGIRVAPQRRRLPSRPLEQIVSRCLEEDPGRRWPSAAALQQALAALTPGKSWTRVAVAALVILALSAAAASLALRRVPPLTDKDTIVLAEFENTTGDPVFDDTLRQGLAVQLQQSPFLSLISEESIRGTLALMQQPSDARLTPELAQDVCVRTASAAVLDGSIVLLGNQYVIGLRAKNCNTGDVLADEQAQAARKEDVLAALSGVAIRFRTRVGESLATIEKHSIPLEEATTRSLEAWRAFSTASRAYYSGDAVSALPLFKRAIAIDPDFAMAHARLGIHYSNVGEWTLARESTLEAYRLRERASDVERFTIDTFYDRQVTGNLERQQQTMESWALAYPRDPTPHGLLAGTATHATGKYELSIAEADKALALEPDRGSTYNSKANSQLSLNRLADAEHTIRRARERNLAFTNFLFVQYFIAFLNGDDEDMRRTAALAKERRAAEDRMSHIEALALARSGRLQEARRTSAVAVDIAQKAGQRERAALFDAATAVWEAFYGNAAAARQKVTTALDLARGRDVAFAAAFALALADDMARARVLADELAKNFPEDTSVQYLYLPTLRALFSLHGHDAGAAIQSLQTASRFELGMGGIGIIGNFGRLYPIYVRGLAYLAARQPTQAAAEFQRILEHPSITLVDPMSALARLQLARAHTLAGDPVKAKAAYEDLLELWKNADADIPLVTRARTEYTTSRN